MNSSEFVEFAFYNSGLCYTAICVCATLPYMSVLHSIMCLCYTAMWVCATLPWLSVLHCHMCLVTLPCVTVLHYCWLKLPLELTAHRGLDGRPLREKQMGLEHVHLPQALQRVTFRISSKLFRKDPLESRLKLIYNKEYNKINCYLFHYKILVIWGPASLNIIILIDCKIKCLPL